MNFATVLGTALVVTDLIIRIAAVVVIPRNRQPSSAMAWLFAVMLIPFFGIIIFLLIGSNRLPKPRRDKQRKINNIIASNAALVEKQVPKKLLGSELREMVQLNEGLGALPMTSDNRAIIHSEYAETINAMAARIDGAKRFVHVEFYILTLDDVTQPFFDALERAHNRGVKVRVLLDYWASRRINGAHKTLQFLRKGNYDWHYMLPVQPFKGQYQRPDLRNHRKLLVIDTEIGFMGSQNVIAPGYHKFRLSRKGVHWVDSMTEVHGPAVFALGAVFVADWYLESSELLHPQQLLEPGATSAQRHEPFGNELLCQFVPSGPGFGDQNNLHLFLDTAYAAKESLIITSPYFVPTESMLLAIAAAVKRNVKVELFVSEISDQFFVHYAQRSYYEALLKAGVTIWQYRRPAILHSKFFIADGKVGVFGSSNMDPRSFELNMEVTMLAIGDTYLRDLRNLSEQYRANSLVLDRDAWMSRSPVVKIMENICRLTSALQ